MIACACALLIAAWLSWTGIEVPPDGRIAAVWFTAAAAALWRACYVASVRAPLARRLYRAAAWTLRLLTLVLLVGLAAEPVVDRLGPFLAYATAPAAPAAFIARLLGLPATSYHATVVLQDLADVPAYATSWEQMGLLPAAAFVLLFSLLRAPFVPRWRRGTLAVVVLVALWIPVRFVLVAALGDDLGWLAASWSPLGVAVSFLPPVWLAERLVPRGPLARPRWRPSRRRALAALSVAAGAALLAFALEADPAGAPRPDRGRILVDDAHSDWEWTAFPFTKDVYGRRSTYNYSCWVDYLSHFYAVDTNADGELNETLLGGYDVLVLKTPTRPYLESERDAIVRYVERGGGLLLISDHTNLFGMTTFLNPIGEPFGVEFLTDDTFDLTSGSPSYYASTILGTPAPVAHLPGMHFETSCSLRPRLGLRPVIVGRALGSEQVDYSHQNFFGNLRPDPDERWGALLQAAAGRRGRGRVIAFTDSTVFSNFSVFFRGIPELGLGMIEFLVRPSSSRAPLAVCALAGAALIALPLARDSVRRRKGAESSRARPRPAPWGGLLPSGRSTARAVAAIAAGSIAGGLAASGVNTRSLPLPRPREPMTIVAFDDKHSSYRLPTLIETSPADTDRCFDAFYASLQRMHLFPRVSENVPDAMSGGARVVVFLNPWAVPREDELGALDRWVRAGGSLLVMESTRGSHLAANALLSRAGVSVSAAFPGSDGPPTVSGLALYGAPSRYLDSPDPAPGDGSPQEKVGQAAAPGRAPTPASPAPLRPAVAVVPLGKGRVIAVLGSEAFSFQAMGPAFNDPTPIQKRAYDRTYALFEKIAIEEGWPETCHLAHALSVQPAGGVDAPAGEPVPFPPPGANDGAAGAP